MSGFSVQFPGKLLRDPDVSSAAKVVYAELLANVERKSIVRIGQRLIAERIGSSVETVARAITELVDSGYIERNRADKGKRDAYQIIPLESEEPKRPKKLHVIRSLPRHIDPEEVRPYFCNREVIQRWMERSA